MKNDRYCLFKTERKRAVWEITHRCNYACKHCCSGSGNVDTTQELRFLEVLAVLDQLEVLGIEEIYYSGGEPFTRDDMVSVLAETRKRNIRANISTNGFYLTAPLAEQLRQIGVNLIHISLDSHNRETYNHFRGGNYFDRTVEAIQQAKSVGLYVRVGAVIWQGNVDRLEEFIEFMRSLSVDELVFNWLVVVGRLRENREVQVPLERFNSVTGWIREARERYADSIRISMHRSEKYQEDGSACRGGESIFYITPEGNISPCSWIAKMDSKMITGETLREKPFTELLEGSEFRAWRQILAERGNRCYAGCPAICRERNGTYFSEDPLLELC